MSDLSRNGSTPADNTTPAETGTPSDGLEAAWSATGAPRDGLVEVVWSATREYTAYIPTELLAQAGETNDDMDTENGDNGYVLPDGTLNLLVFTNSVTGDFERLLGRYEVDAPHTVTDRQWVDIRQR